jgi:hypothetical protein
MTRLNAGLLTTPVFPFTLTGMEIRFTPEEEARFLTAIRRGIEQADQGQFIEEDEMDARVEGMFPSSMETPYFP